jgi:hypothetical protein
LRGEEKTRRREEKRREEKREERENVVTYFIHIENNSKMQKKNLLLHITQDQLTNTFKRYRLGEYTYNPSSIFIALI